jgi:hypothetical protein
MFNFFGKKPSALDAAIHMIYGPNPPRKSADVQQAANLATSLLGGRVSFRDIKTTADQLYAGPIPYSTHDLATSVALSFFRRPDLMPQLSEVQIAARMQVLDWFKAGYVNPNLARAFEDALYKDYKPFVNAAPPKAAMSKAQAKYNNNVRYYLHHIFPKEHWKALDDVTKNSDFQFKLMEDGTSSKEAAILRACAFCQVELGDKNPSDRDIKISGEIVAAANEAEALIADYEGHNTSLNDNQFALWNKTIKTMKDEYVFEFGEIGRRVTAVDKIKILIAISKTEIKYSGFQILISAPLFFVRPDSERVELLSKALIAASELAPDTDDFLMTHDLVDRIRHLEPVPARPNH